MKALKTIVATAVIVLALTSVAMAGVRQVSSRGDSARPEAGTTAPQTHQGAGVTLTDRQLARAQRAVNGQTAKLHTTQTDRDMSRDRARDHDRSQQKASDSVMHVKAQQRTQTHDGDGTHEHGAQSSGTHDSGTHHGGTHNGGAHHE